MRQNGEGQAFILENFSAKSGNLAKPKGGKRDFIQSGLSRQGKKTIRIISDCYAELVTDKEFRESREIDGDYNAYNRFITLTFRQFIPDDKTAKKLLDNFLKRLRRHKGKDVHYVWVAEIQSSRLKNRGERAIHFHILTPEKIVSDTNLSSKEIRVKENIWINRAWNEVVMNWAFKTKQITAAERTEWSNEYAKSESYYKQLASFRSGGRKKKPQKPSKSKFMLLPNCVHVENSGKYMAKYMSKENQNIVGGMYDASQKSRKFLVEKLRVKKEVGNVVLGNEIINFMYHRAKQEGKFISMFEIYNGAKVVWMKEGINLVRYNLEYHESRRPNKTRNRRLIKKVRTFEKERQKSKCNVGKSEERARRIRADIYQT